MYNIIREKARFPVKPGKEGESSRDLIERKTKGNDDFLEKREEIQNNYLTSSNIINNLLIILTN